MQKLLLRLNILRQNKLNFKTDLFDLNNTICKNLLANSKFPWDVLSFINDEIKRLGSNLSDEFVDLGDNRWIHKSVDVSKTTVIEGNCIIDEGCVLRPSSYIRGNVIIGKNVVIGNSTEIKNSIVFNEAELPHYNYVGDSIIGYKAHLGASAICSNLRSDRENIVIKNEKEIINTSLRKIGAIVGDYVEVGCNSVLCPGSVIGRNSMIYPLSLVRGVIDSNSIYKNNSVIIKK